MGGQRREGVGRLTVERLTIPGLSDDEDRTLNLLFEQLMERRPDNHKRSMFYDGKNAVRQVGSVVPPQYFRLAIALGWSAKAVDTLTRRTRLDGFEWAEGDLGSLGIDELVDSNFLLSEFAQALTDSALHGVSFLVTTRGTDGEPAALVHAKDALSATGTLNPRTRRLDDLLSITAWDQDGTERPAGLVLYLDGVTITAARTAGRWQVDRSEHDYGIPVEPLIYKPRPSRRYGQSRLTRPIMGLHAQALRELIRLEGHMDVYSYPEMWMLGADMGAFKNPDGSQRPVWQVMLGRIKGLEDNPDKPDDLARAEVKQFPSASPEPHLKALGVYAKLFAREASLPDSAVAIEGLVNPTSADAYDASQYELIAEAEGARDDWDTPIRRTVQRALAIQNGMGAVPAELAAIRSRWRDVRYQSRAAAADAGMKQLAAVPWLAETEVGLELLGLDSGQIKRAMADRRRAQAGAMLDALVAAPGRPAESPADEPVTAADGAVG